MSAPSIWIILPLILAGILLIIRRDDLAAGLGGGFSFLLALAAWWLPLDTVLSLGSFSFKITTTLNVLGRHFSLTSSDAPLLTIIYLAASLWFLVSSASGNAHRLVSLGLAITALLVASLAVEPFLYAALLIEIATLLTIPLFSTPGRAPGRGPIRFLIFQTLGMTFILFSGWLIAGIEASPSDLALVRQAAILLGLGFIFLLTIFPFSSWIPMLTESGPSYTAGFILWLFPTAALLFSLGFLDHYAWIRESPLLVIILRNAGLIMVATGGLWAAFQHQLGRILGYTTVIEIGLSLLALSLGGAVGMELFFLLLIPRTISFVLWALSLSILERNQPSLHYSAVQGAGRSLPFASSGILIAALALAGFPLLAAFPIRQTLWAQVADQSMPAAIWILVGSLGLIVGIIRMLAVLVTAPKETPWKISETIAQRIFIGLCGGLLFLMGFFPQWTVPLLERLPDIFEHLGR